MVDKKEGKITDELCQLVELVDSKIQEPKPSEVCSLLANEHRWYLINYLIEQDTAVPLSQMAMDLFSRVKNRPLDEVTPSEQQQMRISLEHEHLPRLSECGILSWSYGEVMIDPRPITS
ncbi:hypothetical protein [Haladaptatus sp. CMAA 1911]|uniref:DUF7344 domain-containing protein n=1 Tax=unclassified Haladaptatus TaxID=2622732 RepID=UPI0037549F5A